VTTRVRRTGRIVALTMTGALLIFGLWELSYLVPYIAGQEALGTDLAFYRSIGQRWLETGEFYLPRQLAGPYTVETNVDVLYPPTAIPFFVAIDWLPLPLWWAIPLGVVAAVLWWLRPAMWTWPIIAFLVIWPRNLSDVLYGNTNMWVLAAIAGGIVVGWPAVLVTLKPTLAPFALVGIRHRSWWLAFGLVAIGSIFVLDLWRDYLTAVGNSDAEWYWSLEDVPVMCLPLVAWLGRRDGGAATLTELLRRRPSLPTLQRRAAAG
jgi:hypothetical protein